MQQDILNHNVSQFISNTKLAATLPEKDIKKLMFGIASHVTGGDAAAIGNTGKMGAYGFNLEALQTVGAVVPNALEKSLDSIKKKVGDPLSSLTKKTWLRSSAADPLGKLGLSGLTGKNLGTNFALDVLNKFNVGIPTGLSPAVANNLNFAAMADPKLWVAKVGSVADTANKTIAGAIGKADSLLSKSVPLINSSVTSITSKIETSVNPNTSLTSSIQAVDKLSNSLQSSVMSTVTDISNSISSAKLPSTVKLEFESTATNIASNSDALNRAIDVSFDQFRLSGDAEDLVSAATTCTGLLQDFRDSVDTQLTDSLISQAANIGGGVAGFLNDPETQNNAMLSLLDRNIKSLFASKVIDSNSPSEVIAGLLSVANGQGVDSAIKFARGMIKTSSDGKTSTDYFNVGSLALSAFDDLLTPTRTPATPNSTPIPGQAIAAKPTIANQPTHEGLMNTDPRVGFKDPNNVYPKKDYLQSGAGDVNSLAVGQNSGVKTLPKEETIHGQHDAERTQSKTIAGRTGETVSQPKSAAASKYPHNHTYQSESGHTMEFDDTPHAERVSLNHRTGTFQEMRPDGSQVNKIVGDGYTVIDRNGVITIEGKANVHVGGSCNIYVANNCNLTVGGNTAIDMHGNVDWKVGGNLSLAVKGTLATRVDGELSLDATGDLNMSTSGAYRMGAAESVDLLSAGGIKIDATGNIDLKSTGVINAEGSGNINLKAAKVVSSKIETAELNTPLVKTSTLNAGTTNLKGTHNLPDDTQNIRGTTSVTVATPASAADGTPPEITVVSDPVSPMSPSEPEFVGGGGPTADELKGMDYDGEDGIEDRNKAGIEDTPTPGEEDSADVASSKVPAGACNVTKKGTKLPDINISNGVNYGMKISDYYTLKDVMVKGKLRAWAGFSQADMIANMRCLAVNCLDVIKKQYPDVYFTSGFRDYIPEGGSKTSQHMVGQAVDMKFSGHSKAQYFEIVQWIAKNVPYDQLLLEYLPSGGHWIHISFKSSGNRYQHFTMYNHKRASAPGTFKKF